MTVPFLRRARFSVLLFTLALGLFLPTLSFAESAAASGKLPQTIPLDNPAIRYIGRFTEDKTFQWTASQIAFSFEGESAEVDIKGTRSKAHLRIDVDEQMTQAVPINDGENTIVLAKGLPKGKHLIQITRRSEAFFGENTLTALRLDARAKLLPLPAAERTLLAIGDSITCGYGNGTTDENEHLAPENEFGDTTYAALAARAFGADYHCTAWSGIGIYRNRGKESKPEVNTLPARFDRILPGRDKGPLFNPQGMKPDVITINLNTNDFAVTPAPPKEEFVAVYVKFIKKLQGYWPDAKIICISGPMVGGGEPREYVKAAAEAAASDKVSFLVLVRDRNKEGLGGDWHPSQLTHDSNAKVLSEQIAKVTGWPYQATD